MWIQKQALELKPWATWPSTVTLTYNDPLYLPYLSCFRSHFLYWSAHQTPSISTHFLYSQQTAHCKPLPLYLLFDVHLVLAHSVCFQTIHKVQFSSPLHPASAIQSWILPSLTSLSWFPEAPWFLKNPQPSALPTQHYLITSVPSVYMSTKVGFSLEALASASTMWQLTVTSEKIQGEKVDVGVWVVNIFILVCYKMFGFTHTSNWNYVKLCTKTVIYFFVELDQIFTFTCEAC